MRERLVALGEPLLTVGRRSVTTHVGTSGWQYPHWRGRFYPPGVGPRSWLEHYAATFSTVEVNNSFYRLPSRGTVAGWASRVPNGFVLAMKASRYITHIRRLRDAEEPLRRMLDAFEGAGGKLGPVLFQLPPRFGADLELLASFVRSLPGGLRSAFEFRDPTWFTDEVRSVLDAAGCALVHADRPGVSPVVPLTGGWAYLRFHQGRRAAPGYPRRKLRAYADQLAAAGEADVYAYFNNDADGAAVRDARALVAMLRERGADVSG